jgi:hypothetical protein
MGKTFRRDEHWNDDRERGMKRNRQTSQEARRRDLDDETDEPVSKNGETENRNWKPSRAH